MQPRSALAIAATAVVAAAAVAASLFGSGGDPTTQKLAHALASVHVGGIPAPLSASKAQEAADGNPLPGQKVAVRPAACTPILGTVVGDLAESEPIAGVQLGGTSLVAGRPASTAQASAQLAALRALPPECSALTLVPFGGPPVGVRTVIADADGAVLVRADVDGRTRVRVEGVVGSAVLVAAGSDEASVRDLWARAAQAIADARIG